MKTVQTVAGPVSVEALGSVLMHEHICTSSMGVATHYPQLYRADYEDRIIRDLEDMRDNGVSAVVDAAPVCLGRDVRLLKRSGGRTGIHIIATSGRLGRFHLACDVERRTDTRWWPVEARETVLCPGVTVLNLGSGHSYGMLGMLAELEEGNFLLVFDAVYSAAHFGPPAQPAGVMWDEAGDFAAIAYLRTCAVEHGAKIICGHDMAQVQSLKDCYE